MFQAQHHCQRAALSPEGDAGRAWALRKRLTARCFRRVFATIFFHNLCRRALCTGLFTGRRECDVLIIAQIKCAAHAYSMHRPANVFRRPETNINLARPKWSCTCSPRGTARGLCDQREIECHLLRRVRRTMSTGVRVGW